MGEETTLSKIKKKYKSYKKKKPKKIKPEAQKKIVDKAFRKLHDPRIAIMSDDEFGDLTGDYKKQLDIYNEIENKLKKGLDY